MRNFFAAAITMAILLGPTVMAQTYDNLESLLKDQQAHQVDALRSYIASHPNAPDLEFARDLLIDGLIKLEQADEASALLLGKYESNSASVTPENLAPFLTGTVIPLFSLYAEAGRKDDARRFVERVRTELKNQPNAAQINASLDGMLEELKKPARGDTMSLEFKAIDGREVNLSKLKNHVVLVDFWATWCPPCVRDMPTVKAAYDQYHDKGFDVIGISLDRDKSALEQFVKDHDIAWPQYFDGLFWRTELAVRYGIRGVPSSFLIGRDGKIAAVNVPGDALGGEVARLLDAESN